MFAAGYLAHSLMPLFSANIESDKEKAAGAASRGLTFLLAMSLAISVICIPVAKDIIVFLSTEAFSAGAPIIIILVFASIFIYMNTLINEMLIAKDARRYLLIMAISILAFNITANIIFIPIYSFYAAATLTLLSEILIFIFGLSKARRVIPLKIDFLRMFKLILSAAISIAFGFLLHFVGVYFIVGIILSIGLYASLAFLIDAVPKDMVKDYLISIRKNG